MSNFFKRLNIKKKLLLIILLTSSISVVIATLLLSYSHYQVTQKQIITDLNVTMDVVVDNISAALAFDDIERAEETLEAMKENDSVLIVCLYNENKNLITHYSNALYEGECPSDHKSSLATSSYRYFDMSKNVVEGQTQLGSIYLRADLQELASFLRAQILFALGTILAVLSIIALPIANYLQRSISDPVYELLDTTKRLPSPITESSKLVNSDSDELTFIANALNLSLTKLDATQKELQENNSRQLALMLNKFLTMKYLMHETKLNSLAGNVLHDFLKEEPFGSIQEEYMEVLEKNKNIADSLEKHAAELSQNVTLENHILSKGKESVDIMEIINERIDNIFENAHTGLEFKRLVKGQRDQQMPVLFHEALEKMVDNIFGLFIMMMVENIDYDINLNVEYTDRSASITFHFSGNGQSHSDPLFDFDREEIELKLFNCKFFHNMNNPHNENSFSIDITNKDFIVTSILPL